MDVSLLWRAVRAFVLCSTLGDWLPPELQRETVRFLPEGAFRRRAKKESDMGLGLLLAGGFFGVFGADERCVEVIPALSPRFVLADFSGDKVATFSEYGSSFTHSFTLFVNRTLGRAGSQMCLSRRHSGKLWPS